MVRFCESEQLVLMADEVYQENVYDEAVEFVSARRALTNIGGAVAAETELMTFHTVCKTYTGIASLFG